MPTPMKPNTIQVLVVLSIALLSMVGMTTLCLCAFWKIYIEPVMMIALNSLTCGLAGSLTTLLVGRTVSQLNQNSDVKNTPQIQNQETTT